MPTRRDLLIVVERLQLLIGTAQMNYEDDRNQDGLARGRDALVAAHNLCISARERFPFDPQASEDAENARLRARESAYRRALFNAGRAFERSQRVTKEQVEAVVEVLKAEGWEPAEDESCYDGTLEAMAGKLIRALGLELPEGT
jgi:hypothetical protein